MHQVSRLFMQVERLDALYPRVGGRDRFVDRGELGFKALLNFLEDALGVAPIDLVGAVQIQGQVGSVFDNRVPDPLQHSFGVARVSLGVQHDPRRLDSA